jgi:hypothetical protein
VGEAEKGGRLNKTIAEENFPRSMETLEREAERAGISG